MSQLGKYLFGTMSAFALSVLAMGRNITHEEVDHERHFLPRIFRRLLNQEDEIPRYAYLYKTRTGPDTTHDHH